MTNTNCSGCMFARTNNSDCYFDIPNIVKDIKLIVRENDSICIKDYICQYGFSKQVYDNNPEMKDIDIVKYITDKAHIKYYLVIFIDNLLDNIIDVCSIIKNLDIKPKYISYIYRNGILPKEFGIKISENMPPNIGWKLHNFFQNDTKQDCITISLDTNIGRLGGSDLFLVCDPDTSILDKDILNTRINSIQMNCVVKQQKFIAIIDDTNSLDGLAMSFGTYKFLLSEKNKDILTIIKTEPEFTYIGYNYDTAE